ncbi:hypothetical protein DXG01_004451 [Tephrocybe rancida]|nr:hypothetical protein DXG01_004451 [Tephrocybe rancida]
MPAPSQPVFPALYLYPINDSFIPKHISLAHGQRVKIGRQTNAKTAPGERNGYFDSKVLSRQHAEVWEESGKIFIKDVKSSNGTFINGDRLSPEGLESEPSELKNDDIVEFGIDIVGDDNKTIIHHKVAARVVCVFTEQDVQVAARIEQLSQTQSAQAQNQHVTHFQNQQPQGPTGGGQAQFPFAPGQQRRPAPGQGQGGLAGMGGMGGGLRAPGKSGLTFDHILSRLQGELQKSRDTGSELHTLTGALSEIHETLGGANPPTLPNYPSSLPPVQTRSSSPPTAPPPSSAPPPPSPAILDLQTALTETQSSLSTHAEKVRALEDMLKEQDGLRLEVRALRELVETRRPEHESGTDTDDEEEMHDDDDARSVMTVVPHELDRVEEEDEEELAAAEAESEPAPSSAFAPEEEEQAREREAMFEQEALADEAARRAHSSSLGRPRTPEPNLSLQPRSPSPPPPPPRPASPSPLPEILSQLSALTALTASLSAQHAAAQSTISALESKIASLEAAVSAPPPPAPLPPTPAPAPELVEPKEHTEWKEWKERMETQWTAVRSDWEVERARLLAWEAQQRVLAEQRAAKEQQQHSQNGDAKPDLGLVTPPSPRSLSSDSNRPRRRRRSRSRSPRQRSRSSSASSEVDTDATLASESGEVEVESALKARVKQEDVYSPPPVQSPIDEEATVLGVRSPPTDGSTVKTNGGLATPESSVYQLPDRPEVHVAKRERELIQLQTAVGVLVLGVAAAAVLWRVKPET